MNTLPIKSIWHEDRYHVGFELASLAHLKHLGFPVPDGVVVYPPYKQLEGIAKKYNGLEELFYLQHNEVKNQIISEPISDEFRFHSLKLGRISKGDLKNLWKEIHLRFFADFARAFAFGKINGRVAINPQYVLFTGKQVASGWVETKGGASKITVFCQTGEIELEDKHLLEGLFEEARGVMAVGVRLWWVKDEEVRIVRVSEVVFGRDLSQKIEAKGGFTKKASMPLATKVFYEYTHSGAMPDKFDGVVVSCLEEYGNIAKQLLARPHDREFSVVVKLCDKPGESAIEVLSSREKLEGVIDKYSAVKDSLEGVRVYPCVPFPRVEDEFLSFRTIIRNKGMEPFLWIELSTVESLLHIEQYLMIGIAGALINLEVLERGVRGLGQPGNVVYPRSNKAIIKVLGSAVKLLRRSRVAVVLEGEHVYDQELVDEAVAMGVWGLSTKVVNVEAVSKMISIAEHKLVTHSVHLIEDRGGGTKLQIPL